MNILKHPQKLHPTYVIRQSLFDGRHGSQPPAHSRITTNPNTEANQSKVQGSRNRGYSLIELVVVMSLLLIITMLGQHWLASQLPHWRLSGATRQIVSDFMDAKMNAVTQGNRHRVTFIDEYHYTILDDENNNGKSDEGEQLTSRDLQNDYLGVTLASTNNPIFHPRGTASNLATVTLSNSAGSQSISIGITGRVKIKQSTLNP